MVPRARGEARAVVCAMSLLVAQTGCSRNDAPRAPDLPAPGPSGAPTLATDFTDKTADVMVIRQLTVLPGATGIDTNIAVRFHTPYITKGSRFEVKKLDAIAARARFVREDTGDVVPARGYGIETSGDPTAGREFALTPIRPLEIDQWYLLTIDEDQSLRVLNEHRDLPIPGHKKNGAEARPNQWRSLFRTGNPPRTDVVRAESPAYIHEPTVK
jgi:hypothetical protein